MEKVFLLIILAMSSLISRSQDIIYLNNGSSLEVNDVEIDKKTIKYKLHDIENSPEYSIDKEMVTLIDHANGEIMIINPVKGKKNNRDKKPDKPLPLKRNMFHFHLFDLVFNDFTMSYERLSNNGKMGYQIPLGIGFRKRDYYYYQEDILNNNTLYAGFAAYYYPFGQGKWAYYTGPEFRIGFVKETYTEYRWDANTQKDYLVKVEQQSSYARLFFRNGVMFSPVHNFAVSANFGLGMKYYDIVDYINKTAHFAVNMSYKF